MGSADKILRSIPPNKRYMLVICATLLGIVYLAPGRSPQIIYASLLTLIAFVIFMLSASRTDREG